MTSSDLWVGRLKRSWYNRADGRRLLRDTSSMVGNTSKREEMVYLCFAILRW